MSAWPAAIWESPVLRGLDGRARAEIEAAGALLSRAKGDVVFRPRDVADAFFVVAEGAIELVAGERVVRRAHRGDSFGEEAIVRAGIARAARAVCAEEARVAVVPAAVFARAAARAGTGAHAARVERTLLRAAVRDLLDLTFGGALPSADADALLDRAEPIRLAAGDALYREGDRATCAYAIGGGTLRLETESGGRVAIHEYVARGDWLDDDLEQAHTRGAIACGPSWVVAFDAEVARSVAGPAKRLARQARADRAAAQRRIAARGPQHALRDLHRLTTARSLLVIDGASCVRCGHCTSACAGAHEDGLARLERRGDVVHVDADGRGGVAKLLVVKSCHHCDHAACVDECPTGAIASGRERVTIREDLCIGCGACARACTWGNVRIEARAEGGAARPVAVKCDLCEGDARGPACVRACPADAIARIRPADALVEAGAPAPAIAIDRARAWPFVAGAAIASAAIARAAWPWAGAHRTASGAAAIALFVAHLAYAAFKRSRRARARPHAIAHVALAPLACVAVLAHARAFAPPSIGGAAHLAFWAAALSGALCGVAYALLPRVLARVERTGALPEDLDGRAKDIEARAFALLTGRSNTVKAIWARIVRPFADSRLGALSLAVRGRTRDDEERALLGDIARRLPGKPIATSDEVAELVRIAVDRRAVRVEAIATRALRSVLPIHVVAIAVAVVLVIAHVVAVSRGP